MNDSPDAQFSGGIVEENRKRRIMSPAEEIKVWRDWFAVSCSGWNDVEDIEAELGRDEPKEPGR